jgi:hypothetical protein
VDHAIRVFIVPAPPAVGAPQPGRARVVSAPSLDAARAAAREQLEADGFRVRALSVGPAGLVAYVEERAS